MIGNNGRYSKFQQRLRNIYLNWLKNKKHKKVQQDKFVDEKVKEIRREVGTVKVVKIRKVGVIDKKISLVKKEPIRNNKLLFLPKDKVKIVGNADNSIEIKLIDSKKNNVIGSNTDNLKIKKQINKSIVAKKKNSLEEDDISLLKVEIINKLKGKFLEKEALLEVLESELFFVNNTIDNSLDTSEIKELRIKLKEIVNKINEIIEQYNLYNKSYDLSNIVDIDDGCLVDDLINYRELLECYKDKKSFVKEYKLLNEFKNLYIKLEKIKKEVNRVDEKSELVINKYVTRDKKYNNLKLKFLDIIGNNKNFTEEIKKQNESLNELMKKIDVINSEEIVTTKLVGLNDLLVQSLKFLGFKLLSPLAGFIPSIVGETLVVKNTIKNIYTNLHYDRVRKVHYTAIDYDRELNSKITDINYTEVLVNDTLIDLKKLKEDFLLIYDSSIPTYKDTLKNINKMEEIICKNQYKVKIIKNKLKYSKKINEDKMLKVKKLNENRF